MLIRQGYLLMKTTYFDEKRDMEKRPTLQIGALLVAVAILASLVGCQKGEVSQTETKPVFYPPAPDKPRIQFLMSISGATDLEIEGKKKAGAFEKFVVGDATGWEQTEIAKPFGMALYDGKLYVCDVGRSAVEIIDLKTGKFSFLTRDRRLRDPGNIVIDHGNKYVSDARVGTVFVFDKDNNLVGMWGKEAGLAPVDLDIYQDKLYVLDGESCQVLVFDKITGKELDRIGKRGIGLVDRGAHSFNGGDDRPCTGTLRDGNVPSEECRTFQAPGGRRKDTRDTGQAPSCTTTKEKSTTTSAQTEAQA